MAFEKPSANITAQTATSATDTFGPDKCAAACQILPVHNLRLATLSRYPARGFWYDNSNGNSSRFVRIIAATPMLAAMANSRIVGTGMSRMVINPIVSVINATLPGTSSCRNALRAASSESLPANSSARNARTICTPWLTPIAKMRNGTRIDIGSMP